MYPSDVAAGEMVGVVGQLAGNLGSVDDDYLILSKVQPRLVSDIRTVSEGRLQDSFYRPTKSHSLLVEPSQIISDKVREMRFVSETNAARDRPGQ